MKCITCDVGDLIVSRENYRYTECGVDITVEDMEIRRCPNCGDHQEVFENIEGLYKAIAKAIAERSPKLSGSEIRFLRTYLGLSREDFGKIMGADPRTVNRWQSGESPMSDGNQNLLRVLVLQMKPIEEYPVSSWLLELADRVPAKEPLRMVHRNTDWYPKDDTGSHHI